MFRSSVIALAFAVLLGFDVPTAQADSWSLISDSGPAPRRSAAMAYDIARDVVVMFGGWTDSGPVNETWEWDGSAWTEILPAPDPRPSPRGGLGLMAYDAARGVGVLFGGATSGIYLDDTWEWDGTTWAEILPEPDPRPATRAGHTMAYDSDRQVTVLFGGWNGTKHSDTWEWIGTAWAVRSAVNHPSGRDRHNMVYDSCRQQIVLFGGKLSPSTPGGDLDDTWLYNGVTGEWSEVMPPFPVPGERSDAAMSFDSVNFRVLLFGGRSNTVIYDDTWEWTGTGWNELPAAVHPSARAYAGMAYDSRRGLSVLYGGALDLGLTSLSGETWVYGAPCGNGVVEPGEECDDGNPDDGDGCSLSCTIENGWSCTGEQSMCTEICGDGLIAGSEACDDGFTDDCGTCDATCTDVGTGSTCGDGVVCRETEECDDGFTDDCGTCDATCSGPGTGSSCGDGIVCPEMEACDDGFTDDCGTCNATCVGVGTGSTCGDGVECPETEACDDGNTQDCDGCRGDCSRVEGTCGDGSLDLVCEACDDGNNVGGDGCSATCNNECGDGTCDHDDSDSAAYVESNASCPVDCFCGDDVLDTSEECDDGNNVDCDGCSSNCEYEVRTPLPANPPNAQLKNRYISFKPNNSCPAVKLKVTLTNSLPHPGLIGSSWWLKAPIVADAANPKPLLGPGECVALLGPENMAAEIDWDVAGCQVLHVTGCPIEPTSEYDVRAVVGDTASAPLSVPTILRPEGGKSWGDIVGTFTGVEWTAPQGVVNFEDVSAAIKTWQGGQVVAPVGNIAHLSIPDVEPGDINTVVNFADVLILIKAFQGDPYPFGPADADGKCP